MGRGRIGSGATILSRGVPALEVDALIILVAGQHESSVNAFGRDKALKQGGGKLHGLAADAPRDDRTHRSPVIIQTGFLGNVKFKFVAVHDHAQRSSF